MFSLFSLEKNSTGIFDKFVLFVLASTSILSLFLSLFEIVEDDTVFDIIDIVGQLLIVGRIFYDSKFDFTYLLIYNFITRGTLMFIEIFINEFSSNNDVIGLMFLLLIIFRIFFNAYIFQYCKLKSYKNKEICNELL